MQNLRHFSLAFLIIPLLVVVSACNEQSETEVDPVQVAEVEDLKMPTKAPDDSIPCKQVREAPPGVEIGPDGGYVSAGRHLLSIPPGAVASGKRVFHVVKPDANYVMVQVTPSEHKFDAMSYLALSTAGCPTPTKTNLRVVRWNPGLQRWEDVPPAPLIFTPPRSRERTAGQELTAVGQLQGLSSYALAAAD